jgi:hypothetical protein
MPTPQVISNFSAAQRLRLAYIEFRVWFYGEVARKDVLERFEVATAAGTRDMALYRELAPLNVAYERKAYQYLPTFTPLFHHEVDRVLAAITCGFGAGDPPTRAEPISHAIPARLNQPRLETLATITRAIHGVYALKLTYHSMKTGVVQREIVPHSLVDSGLRWHVRAFDRTKGEFRDLVLTRMEGVVPATSVTGHLSPTAQELVNADLQWGRHVTVALVPHPAHPHPKSIEQDYGMRLGRLSVTLRAAVAGYVLRQWQVDCSPDAHLKGPEFRLWLADRSQLVGVDNAVLAPGYRDQAFTDICV